MEKVEPYCVDQVSDAIEYLVMENYMMKILNLTSQNTESNRYYRFKQELGLYTRRNGR